VRWLAAVDYADMPALYHLADVTVSVARSDGVSLAVLESMAAGTPVVLGDIPHYAELFEDRRQVRLVDAQDPMAIAAGIVEVLRDPALREAMVQAAREKVREVGDLPREAARIEALFGRLLAAPRRTAAGAACATPPIWVCSHSSPLRGAETRRRPAIVAATLLDGSNGRSGCRAETQGLGGTGLHFQRVGGLEALGAPRYCDWNILRHRAR